MHRLGEVGHGRLEESEGPEVTILAGSLCVGKSTVSKGLQASGLFPRTYFVPDGGATIAERRGKPFSDMEKPELAVAQREVEDHYDYHKDVAYALYLKGLIDEVISDAGYIENYAYSNGLMNEREEQVLFAKAYRASKKARYIYFPADVLPYEQNGTRHEREAQLYFDEIIRQLYADFGVRYYELVETDRAKRLEEVMQLLRPALVARREVKELILQVA